MKFKIGLLIVMVAIAFWAYGFFYDKDSEVIEDVIVVTDFLSCAEAGNAVMESYPRQCRHGEVTYTEDIGNELEKTDLIQVSYPRPGTKISSPLVIQGMARGFWFFEATFPVVLTDWDGKIIAEGYATAEDPWMTEEFVSFSVEIQFEKPGFGERGTLVLRKSNPSDLPENDDALEIPVFFE